MLESTKLGVPSKEDQSPERQRFLSLILVYVVNWNKQNTRANMIKTDCSNHNKFIKQEKTVIKSSLNNFSEGANRNIVQRAVPNIESIFVLDIFFHTSKNCTDFEIKKCI